MLAIIIFVACYSIYGLEIYNYICFCPSWFLMRDQEVSSFLCELVFSLLQVLLLFLCMFGILTIKCGRENLIWSSLLAVLNTPSV